MFLVFKILSYLPLWLLQGFGWCVGWLAFLLSPTYRRRFVVNAHQAGLNVAQRRAAVGQSGMLVAELPRLWLGRGVTVQWQGRDHVETALQNGRGVVFLTPHLGCFEITAQAYAQAFGQYGRPMTVLFRPPRLAWLAPLVTQSRTRPGMETAPTTLAGVKQMLKALKAGHCVGLLPDQVPPQSQGVWAPFFGQDAYTMTLSARLATQSGATVLLAWGERLPWGRGYTVHVRPLDAPLSLGMAEAARQINAAMEALILQCPTQYLWGYARYKAPRPTH